MSHSKCDLSPSLTVVGDQIHVECACGLDYYVPRTGAR